MEIMAQSSSSLAPAAASAQLQLGRPTPRAPTRVSRAPQDKITAMADELRCPPDRSAPACRPHRRHRAADLEVLVTRTPSTLHRRIDVYSRQQCGSGFLLAGRGGRPRPLPANPGSQPPRPARCRCRRYCPDRERGPGAIINVSSGHHSASTRPPAPTPRRKPPSTSSRRSPEQTAPEGITVSLIHPYLTESQFNQALLGGDPIVAPAEAPQHTAEYVANQLMDLIRFGDEVTILLPA